MATTIVTKSGSGAPAASDLVAGELAVDLTNKRLYTEDSGGAILELGTNPSGNVTFGDNGKAIFGAGSDLQIYHDPSAGSIIQEGGSGSLFIRASANIQLEGVNGENMAIFNENGSVQLYHDNAQKLATTATGIDVTGTVTADGLSVSPSGTQQVLATIRANSGAGGGLVVQTDASDDGLIRGYDSSGAVQLQFDTDGGDSYIAQGNVGVGTATPSTSLDIVRAGVQPLRLQSTSGTEVSINMVNTGGNVQLEAHSGNFTIDADAVGIGTDSPSALLDVEADSPVIELTATTTTATTLGAKNNRILLTSNSTTGGAGGEIVFNTSDSTTGRWGAISGHITENSSGAARGDIVFATKATTSSTSLTEAMRIDSAGNVLVGGADTAPGAGDTNIGISFRAGGDAFFSKASSYAARFNRNTNDGDVVTFAKDGTTVGSIGTVNGNNLSIGGTVTDHAGIQFGTNILIPESGGTATDGSVDLGYATGRFKDLHLSGSVKVANNAGIRSDGALYMQSNTSVSTKSMYLNTSGDLVFGSSSQGVYLGGTGAANKLDDYEEGTWTPIVQGSTSSGTATYSYQTGNYTKVGNLVVAVGRVSYTGHTGTGNMQLGGLPFTATNTGSMEPPCVIHSNNISLSANNIMVATVKRNDSYIELLQAPTGGGARTVITVDNAGSLFFTITYQAS